MRCMRGLVIGLLAAACTLLCPGVLGQLLPRRTLRGPVPLEHPHLPTDGSASIPRRARARRLGRLTAVLVSALQAIDLRTSVWKWCLLIRTAGSASGRLVRLGGRRRAGSGCREEVLVALAALGARRATGGFTRREVFGEMVSVGTGYGQATVFKVLQRMKGNSGRPQDPRLERVGASSFRLATGLS